MSRYWVQRVLVMSTGAVLALVVLALSTPGTKSAMLWTMCISVVVLCIALIAAFHLLGDDPNERRGRFDAVVVVCDDGSAYVEDARKSGPFRTAVKFDSKHDAMDWCDNQDFRFVVRHEREWVDVDVRSMDRQQGGKS